MKELFLLLSAALTIGSILPYLRDIVRGRTKPRLASWSIWTLLSFIGAAGAWAAGEDRTALFSIFAAIGTGLVVVFGFKRAENMFDRFDAFCLAGAVVGLLLWYLFDSPTIAIVAAVSIDVLGGLPTVRHAWLKPFEETWQTFAVCFFGGLFALASLDSVTVAALAYPAYITFINGLEATIILVRRRHFGRTVV